MSVAPSRGRHDFRSSEGCISLVLNVVVLSTSLAVQFTNIRGSSTYFEKSTRLTRVVQVLMSPEVPYRVRSEAVSLGA